MEDKKKCELLEKAERLYCEKNYREALPIYLSLAEEGQLRGQVMAGWMFYYGLGTDCDQKKAKQWFSVASQANSPMAQLYLGKILIKDNDLEEGRSYFESLLEHGYLPGFFHLGWLYENGKGVPPDGAHAYSIFLAGAEKGHLPCQMVVARKLFKGERGFFSRIKGGILILKTYIETILLGFKDENSERLRT